MAETNIAARLGRATGGEVPFLDAHHLAAAERMERLVRRAGLAQRMTMSYDPVGRVGRSGAHTMQDIGATAADACRLLNDLAGELPADCWGVAFDACGLGLGLGEIEQRRQWPRRSAKLVLRIALDQLAGRFGLRPYQAPAGARPIGAWLPERLPIVPKE
jgi:hypothetical protein